MKLAILVVFLLLNRTMSLMSLSSILGDVNQFVSKIVEKVPIDLTKYELDHICYRCSTKESYIDILKALAKYGDTLVEGMIGNRPISIIKLFEPIKCQEGFTISCIEIPAPKQGSPYAEGLEHAEFVIGTDIDDAHDNTLLKKMIEQYSSIKFDTRAIDKEINADIALQVDDTTSIKFHVSPIYKVVEIEKKNNLVIPVPVNYFD